MRIAPVVDVKAHFSEYLKRSENTPVIITRNGKAVAAIVSTPEDPEELERFILVHTPTFRRILDEADRRIERGGGLSETEFWSRAERQHRSRKRKTKDRQ